MSYKYSEIIELGIRNANPIECCKCVGYGILDNGARCEYCEGSGERWVKMEGDA